MGQTLSIKMHLKQNTAHFSKSLHSSLPHSLFLFDILWCSESDGLSMRSVSPLNPLILITFTPMSSFSCQWLPLSTLSRETTVWGGGWWDLSIQSRLTHSLRKSNFRKLVYHPPSLPVYIEHIFLHSFTNFLVIILQKLFSRSLSKISGQTDTMPRN